MPDWNLKISCRLYPQEGVEYQVFIPDTCRQDIIGIVPSCCHYSLLMLRRRWSATRQWWQSFRRWSNRDSNSPISILCKKAEFFCHPNPFTTTVAKEVFQAISNESGAQIQFKCAVLDSLLMSFARTDPRKPTCLLGFLPKLSLSLVTVRECGSHTNYPSTIEGSRCA